MIERLFLLLLCLTLIIMFASVGINAFKQIMQTNKEAERLADQYYQRAKRDALKHQRKLDKNKQYGRCTQTQKGIK